MQDIIAIAKILHKMRADWAKTLLRACIINPDGSRTIPVNVMKEQIDDILISDIFEMTDKYETEIEELLLLTLGSPKEE